VRGYLSEGFLIRGASMRVVPGKLEGVVYLY
jgi:hypothetical protein